MKRLGYLLITGLGLSLAMALAPTGAAAFTLIATPAEGAGADAVAGLARSPLVQSDEAVFDVSEAAALRKLGQGSLAEARKLEVADARAAAALKAWAAQQGIHAELEENSLAFGMDAPEAPDSGSFGAANQWGISNTGASQSLAIDDLTTTQVPGRAGEDIGALRAPAEPSGKPPVIVAVLDTGIDLNHPDLKDRIVKKPAECAAFAAYQDCLKKGDKSACDKQFATTDTDGNGYPLDCGGWDITAGRNPVTGIYGAPSANDDTGHGTHVAGIIAAAVNARGLRGVAQNVALLPVKVIKTAPNAPIRPQSLGDPAPTGAPSPVEKTLHWTTGFADLIARGMLYAIRSGAQVINMSLAWPAGVDSAVMRRMVQLAQSRGIVVVAAAGNDSADSRVLPCQYPGVICVASHGPDGALSHFSNYGSFVDVAAPGLSIFSTWPMNKTAVNFTALKGYETKNGTSMASPFIAGAVARLLGAGYSAEEAYARLLAGARPHQPGDAGSQGTTSPGEPGRDVKYTRSGNADLAASFAVKPQPLILEGDKQPVRLSWDRKAAAIPLGFTLRNFWTAATQARVTLTLVSEAGTPGAHLAQDAFAYDAWDAGETKTLSTSLVVDDPRLSGRMILEARVETAESPARVVRIPLQISVAVGRDFNDAESLALTGGTVTPGADLRSVTALDASPLQDYVTVQSALDGLHLQLLTQVAASGDQPARYELSAQATLDPIQGDLLLIQRLDVDQDGKPDYVFIYRMAGTPGNPAATFRFVFLDRALKPLASRPTIDYDNSLSVLSERFQWMRIRTASGARVMAPAWVAVGKTPALEKPATPDPWDPNPRDPATLRLYYLAPEGLRTIAMSGDYQPAQLLAQSPAQAIAGEVPVLIGKGSDYRLDYASAVVRDGTLEDIVPFKPSHYRMLFGITNVVDALSMDAGGAAPASVFVAAAARGNQRATFLFEEPVPRTADATIRPPSELDSVMQVSGVYLGIRRQAIFAESHYQLQYLDLGTGQTATSGLDRFSFLPAFISSRAYFPVAVSDASEIGGETLPGTLIPGAMSGSDATEIVVPAYDRQDGHLLGLTRPARFRLVPTDDCQELGNPTGGEPGSAHALVYFCGDRFLRVPLAF